MSEAKDSLTDGDLQSEIELVGELVVAATSSEGPLPQEEIDRLLGVKPGDVVKTTDEVEAGDQVETSDELQAGEGVQAGAEAQKGEEDEGPEPETPEAGG